MTQKNDIVDYFTRSMLTEIPLSSLYETFSFPKSSVRRVLNTGVKDGLFFRPSYATYSLSDQSIYFKIAQTKTGKYDGKNARGDKSDVRIDATISGWIRKDKINFNTMRINKSVLDNLNSEFVSIIIEEITNYDSNFLQLMEEMNTRFEIQGSEIRFNDHDYTRISYSKQWKIENIEIDINGLSYQITSNEWEIIDERKLY